MNTYDPSDYIVYVRMDRTFPASENHSARVPAAHPATRPRPLRIVGNVNAHVCALQWDCVDRGERLNNCTGISSLA